MGDFKKFGKKFDKSRDRRSMGGGFGGGSKFGDRRDDGPRQMYSATCAKCGDACQVPFKPVGGKPVLCSNCFKGKENFAPRFGTHKSFGGERERHGSFSGERDRDRGSVIPKVPAVTKEMFDSLSAKVDKILAILDDGELVAAHKEKKKVVGKEKTSATKVALKKSVKRKKD